MHSTAFGQGPKVYAVTLCVSPPSLTSCSVNSSCLSSLELCSDHLSSLIILLCLRSTSLPQKEFVSRQKTGISWSLVCVFPSLKDQSSVPPVFQLLKAIASYILSSFRVFGGRANLLLTLSKMEVQVLYLSYSDSRLSRVSFKSQQNLS